MRYTPFRVDHGHGIVGHVPRPLEEAHRQHHLQLCGHLAQPAHRRILPHRHGQPVGIIIPLLAEIPCFEKLRQQNHLGPVPGCLPYPSFRRRQILLPGAVAVHLHCRHRQLLSHTSSTFLSKCKYLNISANPSNIPSPAAAQPADKPSQSGRMPSQSEPCSLGHSDL